MNLYAENNLIKSDILLSNTNINYYKTRIDIHDGIIDSINTSINNLQQKTNNYNIYCYHISVRNSSISITL